MWKRFRSQGSPNQVTPTARPPASVSESRDRESQTIKLSHRLVKLPQFTHKGRGRGGDTTIQNEWPAEPGPESRSSGTSLACYPSCHPLEVRAVASGYPLSLPFEVWAIQEYF